MKRILYLTMMSLIIVVHVLAQEEDGAKVGKGVGDASLSSSAQTSTGNSQTTNSGAAPCSGTQLSVRHESGDAGAGQRYVSYGFKNHSPSPCTLSGYPSFVLLDRAGRRIPRQSITHITDPVTVVPLAPGNKAFFNIHYSACMTVGTPPCKFSSKVRIKAPGTNRSFLLRDRLDPFQLSVELFVGFYVVFPGSTCNLQDLTKDPIEIHGFLRTADGNYVTVDAPGAINSVANGINDAGDIVGGDTNASLSAADLGGDSVVPSHNFILRSNGSFTSFDVSIVGTTTLAGGALGIDDRGDIVGVYRDGVHEHGFLGTR